MGQSSRDQRRYGGNVGLFWCCDESRGYCTFQASQAKVHEKKKAEVFKTVLNEFEHAIQTIYSETNEELNLAIYDILVHASKEEVRVGQDGTFDLT